MKTLVARIASVDALPNGNLTEADNILMGPLDIDSGVFEYRMEVPEFFPDHMLRKLAHGMFFDNDWSNENTFSVWWVE